MGFLLMLSRRIQLEQRKNNIEYELFGIGQKLSDLTSYASILSQDSVNISDIASIPSSLFTTGMADLMNAHYQALNMSEAQFAQAMSSGMFGQGDNVQMQMIAKQKMYENARKAAQKQLSIRLNEEEKSLSARKARLETQLNLTEQAIQAAEQREAKDIQSATSSFGLRG